MKTFRIQDKSRVVTVFGDHLATSSSYANGKTRWIVFDLYKSNLGTYVVHRVGKSVVVHTSDCSNTLDGGLEPTHRDHLDRDVSLCHLCKPDRESTYVFPEKERHFVATCDTASGVLDFLSRYDERTESLYYTDVAARLLERACEVDTELNVEYYGDDSIIQ